MLTRVDDFYHFFAIDEKDREIGKRIAARAGERANGMTDVNDYHALAAIALRYKPKSIFEIGTYLGVTSDFFLLLLPDSRVVSIAFENPRRRFLTKRYNNSNLPHEQIGSEVAAERRERFLQLYGDSHKLNGKAMIESHGRFDFVLIDGDHSRRGVKEDTELAEEIITDGGVICWHDANPKRKYMEVRKYLEEDLVLSAVATSDTYIGGIACWSREVEQRLVREHVKRDSDMISPRQ